MRLSTFFFIAIVFLMREKETKGFKSKNGKKQSVRKKEKKMWRYRSNHLEGKSFKWIFTKDPPQSSHANSFCSMRWRDLTAKNKVKHKSLAYIQSFFLVREITYSSAHSFSRLIWSSSSGVKSFWILKVFRISSGVFPLIIFATVLHPTSRRGLISR